MRFQMRVSVLLLITLLGMITVSCTVIPTPISTATPSIPTRQPIPGQPLVKGQLSGLPVNVLGMIYVRLPSGQVVLWGERGNGAWEFVVTEANGANKVVTAEAKGYISQPISYTIHVSGTTAYLVEDGQITDKEAVNLDFHFDPIGSP